ncbi:MAG: AAA family ATPase, partial [Litorimonas sp.]
MAHITSLRLVDFRSYKGLDVALDNGPIVIYGPNGAGKTNLLEAVSMLAPGRGLRRSAIDSLARQHNDTRAPAWGINAKLGSGERISIGQVPEHPRRRTVKIE